MRTWLIRTTNNKILGPLTEKKLKVLVEKGSLEPNDEICSENGYWVFIREEALVKRYLYEGKKQGFNPIYHEYDNEIDLSELAANDVGGDELEIENFAREDHADEDQEDESLSAIAPSTMIKQPFKKKQSVLGKAKTTFKKPHILNGIVLKGIIIIFFILALVLLYFRHSILSSLFS